MQDRPNGAVLWSTDLQLVGTCQLLAIFQLTGLGVNGVSQGAIE